MREEERVQAAGQVQKAANDVLRAIRALQEQEKLSKAAMLRLNDPCALLSRALVAHARLIVEETTGTRSSDIYRRGQRAITPACSASSERRAAMREVNELLYGIVKTCERMESKLDKQISLLDGLSTTERESEICQTLAQMVELSGMLLAGLKEVCDFAFIEGQMAHKPQRGERKAGGDA